MDSERRDDSPLAAAFCCMTGIPTLLLGLMFFLPDFLPDRQPRGEDFPCVWGFIYLTGGALTLIFAIASLVRREEGTRWALICAAVMALQIIGFIFFGH